MSTHRKPGNKPMHVPNPGFVKVRRGGVRM